MEIKEENIAKAFGNMNKYVAMSDHDKAFKAFMDDLTGEKTEEEKELEEKVYNLIHAVLNIGFDVEEPKDKELCEREAKKHGIDLLDQGETLPDLVVYEVEGYVRMVTKEIWESTYLNTSYPPKRLKHLEEKLNG